jgi:hypothetical protein
VRNKNIIEEKRESMPDPTLPTFNHASMPSSTNVSMQMHKDARRAFVRNRSFIVIWRVLIVVAALIGIVFISQNISGFAIKLGYFTIQSNIMVIMCIGYAILATLRKMSGPVPLIKSAVTIYMIITGLVFNLILAQTPGNTAANGIDFIVPVIGGKLSNDLLHILTPIMVALDWLLFDVHGRLQWKYSVQWLTYPLVYVVFILIRGALFTGPFVSPNFHYPYPFLDVDQLGYGGVALNIVIYGIAFLLLGLGFVALDRMLARFNR